MKFLSPINFVYKFYSIFFLIRKVCNTKPDKPQLSAEKYAAEKEE